MLLLDSFHATDRLMFSICSFWMSHKFTKFTFISIFDFFMKLFMLSSTRGVKKSLFKKMALERTQNIKMMREMSLRMIFSRNSFPGTEKTRVKPIFMKSDVIFKVSSSLKTFSAQFLVAFIFKKAPFRAMSMHIQMALRAQNSIYFKKFIFRPSF